MKLIRIKFFYNDLVFDSKRIPTVCSTDSEQKDEQTMRDLFGLLYILHKNLFNYQNL